MAVTQIEKENEGEEIDTEKVTVEITDFEDVPDSYANHAEVWDFAAAFAECEQDLQVVEAALQCDVSPDNIDEAYNGEYDDDEDFAYEMADQLGLIDKDASWPSNCIDWKQAASELMMDYSKHNGYYFRSL